MRAFGYGIGLGTGGGGTFVLVAGDTMTGPLILSGDPVTALGAATMQYVDAQITANVNGLSWKDVVECATTANITLSGEQTIDGVLTSTSRVLVKDQSDQTQNGIYISAAGAWSRSTDADSGTELVKATCQVDGGTQAGTAFTQTTSPVTIGVSNIVWVVSLTTTYTADGLGIELAANQFSLELDGSTLSKSASGLRVALLGITNAEVANAAAIAGTKISPNFGAQTVTTTGPGSFQRISITGTASAGWVNLGAQSSTPGSATGAGDIRLYATTVGFGGFGMKTFGGQGLEFALDQVNTQLNKIVIQDLATMIMANVPAQVGSGCVFSDGVTLSSRSINLSTDLGIAVLGYANGGSNSSTAFTQGSMIFAGASSFVEDNANFFIDNTNNFLGIRTAATPRSALTVGPFPALATYPSIFNDGAFTLSLSDNNLDSIVAAFENTNTIGAANIMLANRPAAFTQGGINLGGIMFGGSNDAAGATAVVGAWIKAINQGTWSATSAPTHLQFETTPTGAIVPVGRMRIFSTGAIVVGPTLGSTIGTFGVIPLSTSNVGVTVKGNASQSGDLYEALDSASALLFRVAPSGSTQAVDLRTFTSTTGVGFLQLGQQTSTQPTAVTNTAKLYTNASGLFTVLQGIGSNQPFSFTNTLLSAARTLTVQDLSYVLANVPAQVGAGIVKSNGTTLSSANIDLTTDVGTSITPIANGGTNAASIAAGLVISSGTNLTSQAIPSAGIVTSNGSVLSNVTFPSAGLVTSNGSAFSNIAIPAEGIVTSNGTTLSSRYNATLKTTTFQTVATTTPTTLTELTSATLATGTYKFEGVLVFQSTATGTGVGLRMNGITATVSSCYAKWNIAQAANGTAHDFGYDQLAITTNVTSASTLAANTDAVAIVKGTFTVSSGGTVAIQLRSETGTAVSIRGLSYLTIEAI